MLVFRRGEIVRNFLLRYGEVSSHSEIPHAYMAFFYPKSVAACKEILSKARKLEKKTTLMLVSILAFDVRWGHSDKPTDLFSEIVSRRRRGPRWKSFLWPRALLGVCRFWWRRQRPQQPRCLAEPSLLLHSLLHSGDMSSTRDIAMFSTVYYSSGRCT